MRVLQSLAAAAACICLFALPAVSATKVEGDYQLMMEMRKSGNAYPWAWNSNDYDTFNNAALRIFSQPRTGVEAFLKVESDWHPNDNNGARNVFQYREAHVRFRNELGKRGIDSYLFSRQDRFYVNTYLIPFVYGRGDAQGARLDAWGFGKVDATLIVADQSNQYNPNNFAGLAPHQPLDSLAAQRVLRTDDMYVARLRREFGKDKQLRTGLTFNRFEGWSGIDSIGAPAAYHTVIGFDSRYRLAGADVALEYGESRSSQPAATPSAGPEFTAFNKGLGFRLPDQAVAQAEIRSIKLGTPRLGYLAVTPGWWSRGAKYQNSLGGPNSDETGFNIQSYYLLPERAITYSNQLLWFGNKTFTHKDTRQIYNELYVEFVNGFTGKTSYRRTDNYTYSNGIQRREIHLDWFNELQVESKLAWLRIQSGLRNIGNPSDKKLLFVIEHSINLTQKTKIYDRFAFGNDASILRKGLFTQLQYRPTGNMEMFLQYGPDYIGGGSNPVEEGNLNGNADQVDIIKFILKGNF